MSVTIEVFSPKRLQALGVSRTTAWRAQRSGKCTLDYHTPTIAVNPFQFNETETLDTAKHCAAVEVAKARDAGSPTLWPLMSHFDDCVQEGTTRCFELSARSIDRAYQWTVCRTAIGDYLDRLKIPRLHFAPTPPREHRAEVLSRVARDQETLGLVRAAIGDENYILALAGDPIAIEQCKEAIGQ